jgi:hypothetical protein
MSLSTEKNKIEYVASAGQTVWDSWDIPYFNNNDVVITIQDATTGIVATPLINQTGFSVVATNGDPSKGATITLDSGANVNDTVVISREVPYTQEYELPNGSSVDPTALNRAFDRTVAQSQQLLDSQTRHLTHPITDPEGTKYEAPSVVGRAGRAMGWNETGDVTALDLAESGTVSGDANAGISVVNNQISAKVDGETTTFTAGNIAVKPLGIDSAQLAAGSVTAAKANSSLMIAIVDLLYPVGSIYTNAGVDTNPATLFGTGIWAAYGAGKVQVGIDVGGDPDFDSLTDTGGQKTHTLTEAEMPPHTHTYDQPNTATTAESGITTFNVPSITDDVATGSAGSGDAHNNLQPYVVVHMWKRTAL